MKSERKLQQGFAAIAAIFLVVVLAALGGFMLTFSNTQNLTATQDLLGSRAYWAARAGLEWGLTNTTNACPPKPATLVVSQTLTSAPLSIDTFSVVVTCSLSAYAEATATPTIPNVFVFTVTAVASSAGLPGKVGYIERSLTASLER